MLGDLRRLSYSANPEFNKLATGFWRKGGKETLSSGFETLGRDNLTNSAVIGAMSGYGLGTIAGGTNSLASKVGLINAATVPAGLAYIVSDTPKLKRGIGILSAGLLLPTALGIGERIMRPRMYERQREREYQQALADLQKEL